MLPASLRDGGGRRCSDGGKDQGVFCVAESDLSLGERPGGKKITSTLETVKFSRSKGALSNRYSL